MATQEESRRSLLWFRDTTQTVFAPETFLIRSICPEDFNKGLEEQQQEGLK